MIDTYWHATSVTANIHIAHPSQASFRRHPLSATVDTSTISLDMTMEVGDNSSTYLIRNSNVCYGGTMELTGTFEFSHVEMIVINKKDVYRRELVGKKQVPLWHKEHCPKVYLPDAIKEMVQGYLKSKWHRVNPSGNTINIYHKTKAEMEAERKVKEGKIRKVNQRNNSVGKACASMMERVRSLPMGYAMDDPPVAIRPGMLVRLG
jgi:hypothetical protein